MQTFTCTVTSHCPALCMPGLDDLMCTLDGLQKIVIL